MDVWKRFEESIAAIHGPGASATGKADMNVRRAELLAMVDAFLGKGYDPGKIDEVERLQSQLVDEQARLHERLISSAIDSEEYVAAVNALISDTFKRCEKVLGKSDFEKLFGGPRSQLSGYIDPVTFSSEQASQQSVQTPTIRHAGRSSATPPSEGGATIITSGQIAAYIAKVHDLSKIESEAIISDLVALLVKNLKRGARVRLAGLGDFQVRAPAARVGRNPVTGGPIRLKQSKKVVFRADDQLRNRM